MTIVEAPFTGLPVPRETPMWTSYSALRSHRNCPQAWHYRYLMGLKPIEESAVERDFGSWWHALRAADSIRRGRLKGSLMSLPELLDCCDGGPQLPTGADDLITVVLAAAETYGRQLSEADRTAYLERIGAPLHLRLRDLHAAYTKRWRDELDREEPVAVEVKWERRIPGTDFTLLGYADEVYYDPKRGLLVVRDHKTGKNLSTQSAADDMMDSQLHLYAWGLNEKAKTWHEAGRVSAIAFDRARMIGPEPPRLTQSGKLATVKGQPSVSGCDLDTYLAWCAAGPEYPGLKKDGSGAGVYAAEDAVTEKLSTPSSRSIWFQRTLTPLNPNLIRVHLQAAADSAADSVRSGARVVRSGYAPRNLAGHCRWCDYQKLCNAQMVGGAHGDYDPADYGLHTTRPADR